MRGQVAWVLSVFFVGLGCGSNGEETAAAGGASAAGASSMGGVGTSGGVGSSARGGGTGFSGAGGSGTAGTAASLPLNWTRIVPTDNGANKDFGYARLLQLYATRADTLLGYAGLEYRSTDRGKTWQPVSIDRGAGAPTAALALRVWGQLAGGRLFASTNDGRGALLASDDDGATWAPCLADEPLRRILDVTTAEPNRVVVTAEKDLLPTDVLVSRDGGKNFTPIPSQQYRAVSALIDRYGTLHLFSSNTSRRTRNDGKFWFESPTAYPTLVRALHDGTLLGMKPFMSSLDYGDTWSEGARESADSVLLTADDTIFALDGRKIARSVDHGHSFDQLALPTQDAGDTWTSLAALSDGTLVLNGTVKTESGVPHLFVSGPVPASSATKPAAAQNRPASCYDGELSPDEERADCGSVCGVCEEWGVRRSEDWSDFAITTKGTLLAAVETGNIRSTDSGATWDVTSSAPQLQVLDEVAGTLFAQDESYNLYVSSDDGAHFEAIPSAKLPGNWLRAETKQRLWSATRGNDTDVYNVSEDGGVTWTQLPTSGVVATPVLFDSQRKPFTLDEDGVYRRTDAGRFESVHRWPAEVDGDFSPEHLYLQRGTAVFFWVANSSSETLYRSEEPFETLVPVGKLPAPITSLSQDSSGNLLITANTDIYLSRDQGSTWLKHKNGLYVVSGKILGVTRSDEAVLVPIVMHGPFYVSKPTSSW